MIFPIKPFFTFIIICLFSFNSVGQPIYDMANAMVDDCEGVLQDSNDGPETGQYDHNEDYTFIICVPEADEIILNFESFATEPTYDILTIYEGNGKTGPIIAQLEGVIRPAPSFIVQNECVTFHFVSDDNILATGWRMTWEVIIDEPKIPEMTIDNNLDCPADGIEVQFDCPVDCDLLNPAQFALFGPGSPSINQIEVLDCDPSTNTATSFKVFFSDSLRLSGTYRLNFEGRVQDVCGEWHDIGSTITFDLSGCPITVIIEELEKACAGDCGKLFGQIIGGERGSYGYRWSHTTDNNPEVDICVDDSTLVTLVVTDLATNETYSAMYWYVPYSNPTLLNKIGLDTFCSNRSDHTYQVDQTGGRAYSRIIPDWEQVRRRYQFWRWNGNPNLIERDIVEYVDTNGCVDRDTFWIRPINAGSEEAACAGSAPFQVNGGTPVTGYWTGNNIDSAGMFNPDITGTYTVTFHAPNGCSRNKTIRVTDSISLPDLDTICGGTNVDLRWFVSPFGGRWSGPQITNNYLGRVRATSLVPNQIYRYYYDLMGCRDSIDIFVEEISAGSNRTICSSTDSIYMNSSGVWTGAGIYDSIRNAFFVNDLEPGEYDYTLEKNGCTDKFELTIEEVELNASGPLVFCPIDDWILIEDLVNYTPGNGTISAPFLKDTLGGLHFNPMQLGPGNHSIFLDALSCMDSIQITIEGPAEIEDYVFCELDDAQQLQANPPGGVWSGLGILDPQNGLFDPQIVGKGMHTITYTSPLGCTTIDTIDIVEFQEAEITGLDNFYCFTDTVIQVGLFPAGGELTINGNNHPDSFNPSVLGPGSHQIRYTTGSGDCESSQRIFFTVLFPIEGEATTTKDSICLGENVVISINPDGGRGALEPIWDRGLGFGNSHIIFPDSSFYYVVEVTDGCSTPLLDSVLVYVYPEFTVDVLEGPEVCFTETTFAEIVPPSSGTYRVEWDGDSTINGTRFTARPGSYDALIINEKSGCELELEVTLPGAAPIKANFSTIPNGSCIDIIDNELSIIDLATGYSEGTIDFGDTSGIRDLVLDELRNNYNEAGEYTITQIVVNELGCTDTLTKVICVESRTEVFIPNAFTPNDDGKNDILQLFALGVERVEWQIFDRYGELVFSSTEKEAAWDGRFNGKLLHNGVYVLNMTYFQDGGTLPFRKTQSVTLIR